MPTAKRTGNKQPSEDPALKKATKAAAKEAESEAQTGDVATASEPDATVSGDELHLRDRLPE